MNQQELEEQGQEAQSIDRENQLLQEFGILQQDYKFLKARHDKLVEALRNANVWLGGKVETPKRPTVWLKKYAERHNYCVEIIEQALKEAEKI